MTTEQIDFSRYGSGGKQSENRQTPGDLQNSGIFLLSSLLAITREEDLSVSLLCLGGVEDQFAIGVADGQHVALIVVLLVEDDSIVFVGVVEEWFYYRLVIHRYYY